MLDYDRAIDIMGPANPFVPTIMVSRAMVKKKMGNLSQCLTELQQAADMMHISLVRLSLLALLMHMADAQCTCRRSS